MTQGVEKRLNTKSIKSLSQLLQGSSRPPGDQGGTNPMQVGLGMSVGSIDSSFTQGNLESTGQVTDLAIEGSGFFSVSNGQLTISDPNGGLSRTHQINKNKYN